MRPASLPTVSFWPASRASTSPKATRKTCFIRHDLGLRRCLGLTSQARNVMRAFMDARHLAPGFLLSCGVLPEVSESVTERLHRVIHYLAGHRFERRRHARALHAALRKVAASDEAFDRIETRLTALVERETTSAYLFGLAVR